MRIFDLGFRSLSFRCTRWHERFIGVAESSYIPVSASWTPPHRPIQPARRQW